MAMPDVDAWELAGFPGRLDVAAYLTADQHAAQYRATSCSPSSGIGSRPRQTP